MTPLKRVKEQYSLMSKLIKRPETSITSDNSGIIPFSPNFSTDNCKGKIQPLQNVTDSTCQLNRMIYGV